ncbi:O-antigen ligase family protein [Croceitalea marina]|uniref:O-antigen ligase family protein n=1 Tax=Croceitalea marina TaxID=1775166 RepID=A0ABW5MYZ0_9FLAO
MVQLNFSLNRLWSFLLYSLALFPLLPRGLESILLICFTILSFLLYLKKKRYNTDVFGLKDFFLIVLLSSIFLIYAVTICYSSNWEKGINQTIRVIPIALFPLVFGFLRKDCLSENEIGHIKYIYIFAISSGLIYLNIFSLNKLYFSDSSHWEIRQYLEMVSNVHGTYMSLWVGFGVLILFSLIVNWAVGQKLKLIMAGMVLIIYFLYWQITIGARMPLSMTIILCCIYLFFRVKSSLRFILVFFLLSGFILFLNLSESNFMQRVENVFNVEHSLPSGDYSLNFEDISSEDIRKGIFLCSWQLIKKSPLVGYGVGDVQLNLNQCYQERIPSNVYQKFLYNSHNQYLHVVLVGGVFALAVFLISLFVVLYISYWKSDYLLFSFTILTMACFMTENLISRHDGIIFYSLFNSILIFSKNEKGLSA